MFAVVANGIQTICKTQRALDRIIAIYPYPKFCKCKTREEARAWILRNSRSFSGLARERYGNTARSGYAKIRYAIVENGVDFDIDTKRVGYIKVPSEEKVLVDSRKTSLKVLVRDIKLNDESITHHIVAIRRILKLLGDFVDVDIVVPDISIFLAVTKYSGKNYVIRGLQKDIESRLGAVSLSIEDIQYKQGEANV